MKKPHARWNGYWWSIAGAGRLGWGLTVEKAYRDWVMAHMLPALSIPTPASREAIKRMADS